MREYATRLVDSFKTGLRPSSKLGLNIDALTECKNAKVSHEGLIPYEKVVMPISDSTLLSKAITVEFPFPQMFKGKGVTLLATANRIFTVDTSDWSLTELVISGTITGSGIWHFIDMYDYWFLFNGTDIVYKSNKSALTGNPTTIFAVQTPFVNTGTYHKGRTFMGGFDSTFWSDSWKHLLDKWEGDLPKGYTVTPTMGPNFVMWSMVGGGDTLWLFDAVYSIYGTRLDSERSIAQPKLFEYFKRNDLGFMPMPWQGEVKAIHPLGKNVIVYGDDGISALVQVTEPVSTYGLRHLLDVGVAGRGAIGVSDNRHIFIDNAGFLWELNINLELKRLNYQEFFTSYPDGDIIISYDNEDDEFYLCNSTTNYILSKGLGAGNQAISSVFNINGSMVGITEDLVRIDSDNNDINDEFLVVTDTFDLGTRGLKNLSFVDLGIDTTDTITVAIDYRYNKASSFTRSSFKPVNNEGYVYMNISGLEFRLVIKGLDFTLSKLSYASIRYKLEDNRGIRGINANETSTR